VDDEIIVPRGIRQIPCFIGTDFEVLCFYYFVGISFIFMARYPSDSYDIPFLGLEYPNRVPASAIARPGASLKDEFAPKTRMAFSRFWLL